MIISEKDRQAGPEITRVYQSDHMQQMANKDFYRATTNWSESSSPRCFEYSMLHVGSFRLVKVRKTGDGKVVVKRTWEDIRQDDKDYFSLMFPVKGKVFVEQNNVSCVVDHGSFVTSNSNKPISGGLLGGDDYVETYSVLVPSYEMNNYLPHLDKVCGEKISTSDSAVAIAKNTFIHLFENANRLPREVIDSYLSASMLSLAAALGADCHRRIDEEDIKAIRIKSLLEYIDCHISQPGLTASLVASECQISTRYLHKLFREEGISFHEYLLNRRLSHAHHWLIQDRSRRQTVEQIAYMSGFNTASHFGRVFKSKYGCTPSDVRNGKCLDVAER